MACVQLKQSVLTSLLGVFSGISVSCWDVHLAKGKKIVHRVFFKILNHPSWAVALLQGHEEPVSQFAYVF